MLDWQTYFQGNFRLMTDEEKTDTVQPPRAAPRAQDRQAHRRERHRARPGVLYGYAFNISKCRGYMDCVRGCVRENNQDRRSGIKYIRIHEMEKGDQDFGEAQDDFFHEVPAAGHFYIGTQCFHCQNPPCVDVCPVQATWMEPDGIVVVDYNWCIGCRYCIAACPYDARRFNWADPGGARGRGEPEPALPRQPAAHEGRRREVHVLHPAERARGGTRPAWRRARPGPASSATCSIPTARSAGCSRTRRSSV